VLRRLIDDLRVRGPRDRSPREVEDLLARCAAEWGVGGRLLSRPNSYTRTCAYRDARFEVVLLRWAPGAASEIHDHGDQHCWMMVLDGRLTVDDYVRLDAGDRPGYAHVEPRDSRLLGIGAVDSRAGRFDLHRVGATLDAPAVSLHLYAAPLRQYLVYNEETRRCTSARGTYDEVMSIYTEAVRR
jgi:cysteine dioxygenase